MSLFGPDLDPFFPLEQLEQLEQILMPYFECSHTLSGVRKTNMITLATATTMHSAMVQTARSRKKSRFSHDVIGTIHILR